MAITNTFATTWQQTARLAQLHREASLAKVDPPLPDVPGRIANHRDAPDVLLISLATGRLKAVDVVNAYLRRAALAQNLTNCLTELLSEPALKRAQELDSYYEEHQKPIGPLHGLPISVKEHIEMEGLGVNSGFVSGFTNVAKGTALILKILYESGAVFHARTTQPQTTMHLETSSNLYGVTVNPFNRNLTAGGSSGGEGALIGLRGSCLGIGTDIGGSIRSPAANNGLFGFRPTSYRLPISGNPQSMGGEEHIVTVIGPLSSTLFGIKIFMKSLIDPMPWLYEPSLVPMPWRDEVNHLGKGSNRKLKVAVLYDDGVVRPHPPIIKAMEEVVWKLRGREGIELVEWIPWKHEYAWELTVALYFPDGGLRERTAMSQSGEQMLPMTEWLLNSPHIRSLEMGQLWELTQERELYRNNYAKLWNDTATGTTESGLPTGMVDVILCPVGPGAAPPLNNAKYWPYTSQWNLLDYPAMVFPTGKMVDPVLHPRVQGYQPHTDQDWLNHELYEPEKYRDAPISLQLVGRRFEDEKLIQAYEFMSYYL